MKDGKSAAVESAETVVEGIDRILARRVVEGIDRILARRAELLTEYDRLGVILAEIRDKAAQTARKPKKGTFARMPRRKTKPEPAAAEAMNLLTEREQ